VHVNHSAMGSWWAKVHSMSGDDYNVAFVSGVANVVSSVMTFLARNGIVPLVTTCMARCV